MGLKKRSKVSAEFNMSSLTDIIFLLLIFFMLTSSLVVPNALNLKLPSSSSARVVSSAKVPDVAVNRSGSLYYNGRRTSDENLENSLQSLSRKKGKDATITISPAKGAKVQDVVKVMDMAVRYKINAILASEK